MHTQQAVARSVGSHLSSTSLEECRAPRRSVMDTKIVVRKMTI